MWSSDESGEILALTLFSPSSFHCAKVAFCQAMIHRCLKCNTQHFHVISGFFSSYSPFSSVCTVPLSLSLSVTVILAHSFPDTQSFSLPSFPRQQTVVQRQALHLQFRFDGVCVCGGQTMQMQDFKPQQHSLTLLQLCLSPCCVEA